MLEEKLRKASQYHAKNNKRMLSMLAIAAFVIAIFIMAMWLFDFNTNTGVTEVAIAVKTPPSADTSKLREQFIQQLHLYENDIAPALANANLKAWNADKELVIAALKNKASVSFATGDYPAALQELSDLESMARQLLTQREEMFSSALSMAKNALAIDNHIEAKQHISKALLLKPDNPDALKLAQRIGTLPKILELLKKAAVARTENNPEKEYTAVAEALKLDPDRQALKQRKAALEESIKESQFAPLIALGLDRVKHRKLQQARSSYHKAKQLYPGRSELRVLNTAINRLAVALDLESAKTRGKAAIDRDQWNEAQSVYAAAAKRHPDDKTIRDGLQLSNKLVSLHQVLSDYLRQPERLAAGNVAAGARQALDQVHIFAQNSQSLSRKETELKALLVQANIKIPVTVTSDNQTYILVKGIGKIGITQQRTIRLKAGTYTFEGIREGYKSKLVEVRIPIGSHSFDVKVVCDERI